MLTVEREPKSMIAMGELEHCCFCRTPTPTWTTLADRKAIEQVACCEQCALKAEPKDVPSKEVWCRREEIARGDD